jgi:hypothetical protein
MKITQRSAARAFGLALGACLWIGGLPAQAQWAFVGTPNRTYTTPYRYPNPTYAPRAWTYAPAPTYARPYGSYRPIRGRSGAAYRSNYGYSPARRPLFLHKPWLKRD